MAYLLVITRFILGKSGPEGHPISDHSGHIAHWAGNGKGAGHPPGTQPRGVKRKIEAFCGRVPSRVDSLHYVQKKEKPRRISPTRLKLPVRAHVSKGV